MNTLGVIVARMQVPALTTAHKYLIKYALEENSFVVLFLGTSKHVDSKNPLTFIMRREMIRQAFKSEYEDGKIIIQELEDMPGQDEIWVSVLDAYTRAHSLRLGCNGTGVMYGSRDSFLHVYDKYGTNPITHIPEMTGVSGSNMREQVCKTEPKYSVETAQAIIWAINKVQKL